MNVDESAQLSARIGRLWKIYQDDERRRLLMLDLQKYEFRQANDAIDRLLRETKSASAPSIEEIMSFIRASGTFQRETGLCSVCGNSGWFFVSDEGHGTVMRCECGGRFEKKIDSRELTSEGFPVATPDEKREAIIRGFKRYKPDATQQQIEEHLARFGVTITLVEDPDIF